MESLKNYDQDKALVVKQLELLKFALNRSAYPDYPEFSDRLFKSYYALDTLDDHLVISDGTWTIDEHPNREDKESRPNQVNQDKLVNAGLELDSKGRPLHPWLSQMIGNIAIGVVTGKGFYREWGPNKTATCVVKRGDEVLIVRRRDTGNLALPGGFVETNESKYLAALRELKEETGILLPYGYMGNLIYEGPVADIRMTANAWPEDAIYVFDVTNKRLGTPVSSKETSESLWLPFKDVSKDQSLFGAHKLMLNLSES